MSKTAIEWCDWTINPVKGFCPVACKDLEGEEYCYARRMYRRFKWDYRIRYEPLAFDELRRGKPGDKIFIGSTMELFGPWVDDWIIKDILENVIGPYPQRTFIFLTKRPWELKRYNPWPENAWVGFSATDSEMFYGNLIHMLAVEAKIKFVSFEPLLADIKALDHSSVFGLQHLQWIIIGQRTPTRHNIPKEWIDHIIEKADREHVPIFCKDNLKSLMGDRLRQEWPKGEVPK